MGEKRRSIDECILVVIALVVPRLFGETALAGSLGILHPEWLRSPCMMPGVGLSRVALSGIGVRQELIVPNRPTSHEIEANTMFDRLDSRRVGFDIVTMKIVLVCYGTRRERQRREI
ncbi:hypothetical protein DU504_16025 [Haloplanus salinus]|uniref:Uncharacterized protein n=1 Tax=Haloplanus salinus TaxID=1126245 RepID=A0A368N185_9EURY|nr:hypothetical protein [Haloplanus salinus]RCU44287.1 hypothetical protein DU504_16025 [Haloplanus salinus]